MWPVAKSTCGLVGCHTVTIIAIIGIKGGSGKSTMAVHLAVAAHQAGFKTAIIDSDSQATARMWGDRRGEAPFVTPETSTRYIGATIDKVASDHEVVVIDTPGRADPMMTEAAKRADLILLPIRPSINDMDTVDGTVETLRYVPKKQFYVIFTQSPVTTALQGEEDDCKAALEAMQVPCGFQTGAPTFHARKAFRSAMVDGHTAQEYEPEGKAALEAARMWEWVQATLKLKSKKPRKKAA